MEDEEVKYRRKMRKQANKKEAKKKKERAKMRLRRMSMGLWPIVAVAAGDRVGWASPRQDFEKNNSLRRQHLI